MSKQVKEEKLPLQSRKFYLDINGPDLKKQLVYCVKKLGGTVEEFLDKRVRYVITDRPEKDWPSGAEHQKSKTVKDATTVTNVSTSVARAAPAESKLNMLARTPFQRIAFKPTTQQSQTGKSSNVLDTAYKLNMRILAYKDSLKFFRKHMKIPGEDQNIEQLYANNKTITTVTSTTIANINGNPTAVKIKQLRAPFLKFEDKEEKYQPSVKEFDIWPELNLKSAAGSCPFSHRSSRKSVASPAAAAGVTTTAAGNGTTTNLMNNNNNNNASTATIAHPSASIGIRNQNVSGITSTKPEMAPKPIQTHKKKQRVLFCEICLKEFSNMAEHIKTQFHQDYMENDQHYKELRNVIDSLPAWTSLNDVQRFIEEEDSSEVESEIETEMDSDLSTSDDEEEEEDVEDDDNEEEDDDDGDDDDEDEEEVDEEEHTPSIPNIKDDKNLTFDANISPINGPKVEKRKASLLEGDDDDDDVVNDAGGNDYNNQNDYDDPVGDNTAENKSRLMNDHHCDHQQVMKVQRRNEFEEQKEDERKEKDYDDDHFCPKLPPNHSVIINLNAEINRAIGEGTLLPLHRHINRKTNTNDNHWQHIQIQNDSSKLRVTEMPVRQHNFDNGDDYDYHHPQQQQQQHKIERFDESGSEPHTPSDLVPASCSSPIQPFRLKHVFADLTNDKHVPSEEF